MVRCPKCNMEIESLDFDVTSTCSGSIYRDSIIENSWGKTCLEAYDSDSLLGNVEFDNFRCSECQEVLFETEEEALNFLGNKKVFDVYYYDKKDNLIDKTQIDEKNVELAKNLFVEFGHKLEDLNKIEFDEVKEDGI